jgi:hypothetical protein
MPAPRLLGLRALVVSLALLVSLPALVSRPASASLDGGLEVDTVAAAPVRFAAAAVLLGDGSRFEARLHGPAPLAASLAANRARPVAIAAADFDGDGVRDVACGYDVGGRGAVVVYVGNVDAIYPNAPDAKRCRAAGRATRSAFLPDAIATALDSPPELLAAGDFDADGRADLAAAARGARSIRLLSGTGRGGFDESRAVDVGGSATAMAAGEIGLADGLDDLAVGVAGADGHHVVNFAGPAGAARAEGRRIPAPGPISALAIGRLGRELVGSVALAAGSRVAVASDDALVDDVDLGAEVVDVALGRLFDGGRSAAALASDGRVVVLEGERGARRARSVASGVRSGRLVAARVGGSARDDLVALGDHVEAIVGPARGAVRVAADGAAVAGVAMRLDADAFSDLVVLEPGATVPTVLVTQGAPAATVTNANDDGPGSLRQAIFAASARGGGTVVFDIPGDGPHTIAVRTALPAILDPITIDATTQPGYDGRPVVEIDNSAVPGEVGLNLAFGASVVRGLAITGAGGSGISIFGAAGNIVEGNYVGLDPAAGVAPNAGDGVTITASDENVVGGTTAAARNVLSGNDLGGVGLNSGATANLIAGNYIGVDPEGAAVRANFGDGVYVEDSPLTAVGSQGAGGRNVISGNARLGVAIFGSATVRALVQGNYVGLDAAGTRPLANGADGVYVFRAPDALVGGTAAGQGNVLSGNALNGIAVNSPDTRGAAVVGNLIGTDAQGARAVGNIGNGVYVDGATDTLVGGSSPGAANVISGNESLGVGIFFGATGTRVQGNRIGLGVGGEAVGNLYDGVYIQQSNDSLVGGTAAGEGNTIAANRAAGVLVFSGERNSVLGNSIANNGWIGIDVDEPGIATNDAGDADTGGNTALNHPLLTTVLATGATTTVRGVYSGAPGLALRLEFYASADCDVFGVGEGEAFVGAAAVTTDGSGTAQFDVSLPVAVPVGSVVTATATDAAGNTSEFSECAVVELSWDPPAVEGGPPRNLTLTAAASQSREAGPDAARRADVAGYKVYRSDTRPVQPTPDSLFTSVPPTQTTAMAPASSGGFFVVTACYSDGSESGPSNDAESAGAPVLMSVTLKGASKLVVDGSNITAGAVVFADGIPFVVRAKVKRQGTRVIQKGPLLTQQTVRDYLESRPVRASGRRQVLVGVRNSTGAVTAIVLEQ